MNGCSCRAIAYEFAIVRNGSSANDMREGRDVADCNEDIAVLVAKESSSGNKWSRENDEDG
jgi:hypothetical protein